MVNRPVRKIRYVRVYAAGINSNAPSDIIKNPNIIPRLKPTFFNSKAEFLVDGIFAVSKKKNDLLSLVPVR